jgi:hypothetical protein
MPAVRCGYQKRHRTNTDAMLLIQGKPEWPALLFLQTRVIVISSFLVQGET